MLVYYSFILLILLLSTFLSQKGISKSPLIITVFSVLCLILISSLRGSNVGVDTEQFCRAYERIGSEGASAFFSERYEPLFIFMCLTMNCITDNYQLLLFVSSLVILVPVGVLIYHESPSPAFSFIIYITLNFYFVGLNMMRQAMAMSVFILAVMALRRKKLFKYIGLSIIACLLHYSVIVAVVCSLVIMMPFSKRLARCYIIFSALLAAFAGAVLQGVTEVLGRSLYDPEYLKPNYFGAVIICGFTTLLWLICYLCWARFEKQVSEKNHSTLSSKSYIGESALMHLLSLWLMFNACAIQVEAASRIAYYFGIFAVVAIPRLVANLDDGGQRRFVMGFIAVSTFIYCSTILVFRPEWFGVTPYTVFF